MDLSRPMGLLFYEILFLIHEILDIYPFCKILSLFHKILFPFCEVLFVMQFKSSYFGIMYDINAMRQRIFVIQVPVASIM